MKAVVLAAGKGHRLWPLTNRRPKPMIPVANRPILEHVVTTLDAAGVSEVILVVGANRERIQSHFGNGEEFDLKITYTVQAEQLGTGHALLQAADMIGDRFLALNGDRIIDPEIINAVQERYESTGDPTMAVTRVDTPSDYGVVDVANGTVQAIEEQPIPELAAFDLINAGVYAFNPDVFAAIRQTNTYGEQALTDALETMIDTQRVQAVPYDGLWADVSVPWDLLTVADTLLARETADTSSEPATAATRCETAIANGPVQYGSGVEIESYTTLRHSVALGDNVRLYPNVTITNSILLSDVTIKSGTVITDSIIGANTTVGPNTTLEAGPANVVLDGTVYNDVTFGSLLGDNVEVGANVTIRSGTIVGSGATIDSGTHVSEQIDDHSHVTRG